MHDVLYIPTFLFEQLQKGGILGKKLDLNPAGVPKIYPKCGYGRTEIYSLFTGKMTQKYPFHLFPR